jgi:diguanylate cyclase (GGDEF)-like protein/PAS domain S-box-containing protein
MIKTPRTNTQHRVSFLSLSSVPARKEAPVVTDKTDKGIRSRRTQERLQTSEVRYRRLFETAKDGILLLDADTGRITDVNPFLEDMLGYSHTELIGKALWEIGPVKDITASQDAMRHLQNNEYIRYENLPLETKAGQQIQVEFVSNVYLVNGFRVIQCNVRDITARKRAEVGMRTANDELMASVAELRRRDEEMKSLIRLNELLQSCTTQAEAYQVIALKASELFAHSGGLAIVNAQGRYLDVVAHWRDEAPLMSRFSLGDCWAMRRGQLHEVIDPRVDLRCQHFVHQPQTGYLCVPLIVQGEITGLLCLVGAAAGSDKHHVSQQQLAVTVGETIKLSLSNLKLREKLREEAIHDPLTGLFNRRFLEENLTRELHRARRRNSPLCVVMLDLDQFKHLNDTFGHDAGDALLHQLGQMLREKLRKSDIACRYGGDEFVLVLPDSSLADAQRRVEQIRVLVKELQIRHGGPPLDTITVSAGVAGAPEHNSTAPELIHAADNAMYAAKQAGGDRVIAYQAKEVIAQKQIEAFKPAPTG